MIRKQFWIIILFAVVAGFPAEAEAVVGYAERYDDFKERDLTEFHRKLVGAEEDQTKPTQPLEIMETIQFPSTEQEQAYDEQLASMKKQILKIPERDRIKFGLDGQYTFESNVRREPPGRSHSDSIFDTNGFVEFDLGGKKTDLRLETRGGKQWNIHFSENDFWTVEERIRYRRKYFRKITHSVQSRIARHSSKTVEIDEKKVRWDSHQNTVFNYAFSRKLSLNAEFDWRKRTYTTEAFDQDSEWDVTMSPSAFWHLTPKSRVALTYTFGASRIRSKIGDANSHEIHLAYFGRVTRKSSLSFDFSFSHQTPRALETPTVNTIKLGAGFIWQWTPKTQLTIQAIRQLQDTSSDRVALGSETVVKEDVHYTNDSLSLSLNSRLSRKMTGILTTGIAHVRTEAPEGADEESIEGRHWTFPTSLTLTYALKRWVQMRLRYTFSFRTGNEKDDTYRAHVLTSGMNLYF